MTKVDQLIEKFKELKEELNKNMNMSYAPSPNAQNATTGTSGGQGGMYRSESMDKNVVAPVTMQMSEDVKKDMVSASPGGAQDIMQMSEETIKFDKNGQWKLDKVDPQENVNIAHPKGPAKKMKPLGEQIGKEETVLDDGVNREANPKMRMKDLGPAGKIHRIAKDEGDRLGTNQRIANPPDKDCPDPRGKVHMVKEEGTNEEANPSKPHNKAKFKVMSEVTEKESKKEKVSGLPYNGDDKNVHKADEEEQREQNRNCNRGAFGPA